MSNKLSAAEVTALKTFFPNLADVIDSLDSIENVVESAELLLRRRNDLRLAESRVTVQGDNRDRAIKGHRDAIAHEQRAARLLGGALRQLRLKQGPKR